MLVIVFHSGGELELFLNPASFSQRFPDERIRTVNRKYFLILLQSAIFYCKSLLLSAFQQNQVIVMLHKHKIT